ncbi:hypothetical protein BDP27DRAFT_1320165 [Rhodocollybia butyracea]|uniref:Uncharacterized protein n=1 Tax=Rhodocollybia butyracea TaxID=206335 RepID=A0A9P5PUC6_9AGAR|nr:hypothetical protein BDP27DRAFT_1320165 [Rhodocollybia butyracea]
MSASSSPCSYFRCRTIARHASPPVHAFYDQIPPDDDYSDSGSESCSEDDEDYSNSNAGNEPMSDSDDEHHVHRNREDDSNDLDMDIDEAGGEEGGAGEKNSAEMKRDVKGKQKAIDAEPESEPRKRQHRRRQRHNTYTLRPILTIQRSQGFVWNQDLFIPPYIKDRYVASTSPPNSLGSVSTSLSSTNSSLNDYEVEMVEIRVQEGDLEHIIP